MEKYLSVAQVKELGFTDEDIKNAQPNESYYIRPEKALVDDFKADEYFEIKYGILFHAKTIINYKGLDIHIFINKNYKSKFIIYMNKTTDMVEPRDIPAFTDKDIYKYNKNKVQNRLDFIFDSFSKIREKKKKEQNYLDTKRQEMESKGFEFYSNTHAIFKNDNVTIEIELYNNGFVIKRVSNNKINNDEYIDKLISM